MTHIEMQQSKGRCGYYGRKLGNQEARGGGAMSKNP